MEMLDQDMPVYPKRVHTPPSSQKSSPNEEKTDSAAPLASSPDIGSRIHRYQQGLFTSRCFYCIVVDLLVEILSLSA